MKQMIYFYLIITMTVNLMVVSYLPFGDDNFVFAAEPVFPLARKNIPSVENKAVKPAQEKSTQSAPTQSAAEKAIASPSAEKKFLATMAERHIFSPDPDSVEDINSNGMLPSSNQAVNNSNSEQQSLDMLMQKVKRELELTGIIITPESKKAMILYKGKGTKKPAAELYDAGASIDDYLLKEVFPNYVVISQNNQDVKIALFKERQDRPELPKDTVNQNNLNSNATGQPIPVNPHIDGTENLPNRNISIPDGHPPINFPRPASQSMPNNNAQPIPSEQPIQNGTDSDAANPFVKALQGETSADVYRDTTDLNNSTDGTNMGGNPFLQAIQRARERQRSQQ
ncbi:MAG: hypothetical protein HQK73_03530 [Desulfamplus sp.]|nr:hypothetical protein [Desulfamplus sp.]